MNKISLNKKSITLVIVGLFLVLGFGIGYFAFSNSNNNSQLAKAAGEVYNTCQYGVGSYGSATCLSTSGGSGYCSATDPCALFETALTYSPTQALAKRYGASGSTNSSDLILTLKDTRLETTGFTTTCSIKYKFRTDTNYRTLTTNSVYNNTTGCNGNLLKANQLLFNVDFEITAITTNPTSNITKNYLIYSNYDFKAGSIGVTSIGGSGL